MEDLWVELIRFVRAGAFTSEMTPVSCSSLLSDWLGPVWALIRCIRA